MRSVIPESFPDSRYIIGEVWEGFTFDGIEVDVMEVPNPALGRWYRDRDGTYYWGGGLREIREEAVELEVSRGFEAADALPQLLFDPNKMSWGHKMYDIPFIWKDLGTKGEGVTVAVIDTGIDTQHADLKANIHPLSKSFLGNPPDISDVDPKSHGTRMAGIIAGTGEGKVFGIAPAAKLLVLKATQKKFDADINKFIEALKFAASIPEIDIVSISYTLRNTDTFRQAIEECLAAKKIVLAAIGNGRDPEVPEDGDTFPSSYNSGALNIHGDEVIAIGAFDEQGKICGFSNSNKHLSFLAPGMAILTANINNSTKVEDGTSVSTAFTAGCLALMVSYCKLNNKPVSNCTKALLTTCDDLGPDIGHDSPSGFGIMNIRNAIARIK